MKLKGKLTKREIVAVHIMRTGQTLCIQRHNDKVHCWYEPCGKACEASVFWRLYERKVITAMGDSLFDGMSQTYRLSQEYRL